MDRAGSTGDPREFEGSQTSRRQETKELVLQVALGPTSSASRPALGAQVEAGGRSERNSDCCEDLLGDSLDDWDHD